VQTAIRKNNDRWIALYRKTEAAPITRTPAFSGQRSQTRPAFPRNNVRKRDWTPQGTHLESFTDRDARAVKDHMAAQVHCLRGRTRPGQAIAPSCVPGRAGFSGHTDRRAFPPGHRPIGRDTHAHTHQAGEEPRRKRHIASNGTEKTAQKDTGLEARACPVRSFQETIFEKYPPVNGGYFHGNYGEVGSSSSSLLITSTRSRVLFCSTRFLIFKSCFLCMIACPESSTVCAMLTATGCAE